MALTPRQLAVIRARARAKRGQPAAALTRPTALGGLGYQPEEEASRQAFRQGAANVAVPTAPAPKPPSRLSAAAGQFAQSATLGQAPNILALPNAPSGQFAEAKKFYQQRLMQGSQEFPVTTAVADIAGFFAPGGAALKGVTTAARPVIKAVQEAPAVVRGASKIAGGAALGATEGALYGGTVQAERQAMEAGQAAPTMQQRGEAAAPAAAMGAVVGGALPIAGRVLKPVGTAIAGQTAKLMGPGATRRQAERVAQKAVRADLQRAGINNLDDFLKAAEQYRGKPAMTGELAQSTLNTLTALVRGKGTTGDKVQAILADRVAGFPARMMRDLEASTGLKADEILGDIDAMVKAGREIATPQYDIAKAAPFKVSEKLQSLIDRSPTVQQAVEAARGVIADKAAAAGKSVDEIPPLEFYDEVKQQIDRIEFSGRKLGDRETRQIDEVRRAFVQALDEIVPGAYAAARKAGGEAPKIREAVKLGQNSYTKPLEQVVADIAGMGEPALKAYRGAFVTNLVNKIRMGQLKPAALRSPNLRDKMATLFGEDAADQLVTKFSQEFDLLKKGSRLDPNVGSVTSQALLGASDQALDDILNAGSQAVSIARSLASGQLSGVIGPALNYFRRAGYTEAQLNAIGDLLASDPQRAARILFPNEMARLGGTPGGAAANVLANPPQPPSGGRNTLATPYELGGALTGGAIGATQGETPEERARNALLGAAGGAVAGRIARKAPIDRTTTGSNLGNLPKPVAKARSAGYEGADIGEAKEWVQARNKGLDMSQPARLERAKAMGFDTEQVLYHGTTENITSFDLGLGGKNTGAKSAKSAIWLSNNPEASDLYTVGDVTDLCKEGGYINEQAYKLLPRDEYKKLIAEQNIATKGQAASAKLTETAKSEGGSSLAGAVDSAMMTAVRRRDGTRYIDEWIEYNDQSTELADAMKMALPDMRAAFFHDYKLRWAQSKDAGAVGDEVWEAEKFGASPNIVPVYVRLKNPLIVDQALAKTRPERFSDLITRAKENGHDGLIVKNTFDPIEMDAVAIFDPSNIRSVNAAFDPASKESANILAGVGAVGAGTAAAGAMQTRDKKTPRREPRG